MDELKACPWCGPRWVYADHAPGNGFRSGCENCRTFFHSETYDGAVEKWNARRADDAGRLREALNNRLDRVYKLAASLLQKPHSQEEIDVAAHRLMDAAGLPSWLPGSSDSRNTPASPSEESCGHYPVGNPHQFCQKHGECSWNCGCPPSPGKGGDAVIQWLKCRFLPWHNHTWTGRKSETGYVWESRCSCGSRWAVMMCGEHAMTALPGNEFEAAIGYAPAPSQQGDKP